MSPFPQDLQIFLYKNIESIDQLEILRILGEDRQQEWDYETLAVEVQSPPLAVRAHLVAMQTRKLLVTTTQDSRFTCRYGPSTPDLKNMISRLLQIYKERPVTMIRMIYERAKDPLRTFTDEPRIKEEG